MSNSGPEQATDVFLQLTLAGMTTSQVSPYDLCESRTQGAICRLNDLAAGGSAVVELTARPSEAGTAGLTAEVSSNQRDLVPANNIATATVEIEEPDETIQPGTPEPTGWVCSTPGGATPTSPPGTEPPDTSQPETVPPTPGDLDAAEGAGGEYPENFTAPAGATDVTMLDVTLNPGTDLELSSITVQASGSGDDQVGVSAVKLSCAVGDSGIITVIAQGVFLEDDGMLTPSPAQPIEMTGQAVYHLEVTYDFADRAARVRPMDGPGTPGAGDGTPAHPGLLFPAAGLGWVLWSHRRSGRGIYRRPEHNTRRITVGTCLVLASLLLPTCSSDDDDDLSPDAGETYRLTLIRIDASVDGEPVAVTGLPLSGPEVTVE